MPQGKSLADQATCKIAQRVAAALELRISERTADDGCEHPLTPFDSASVPPVSMSFYLERLAKFCHCGGECFIVALCYVDKVTQCKALTPLSERNVHRLFLTCLLVAHKFWDDYLPLNSHYAICGGISLQELNQLEKFFLKTVGFKLNVSRATYAAYETAVTAIERLGQQRSSDRIADGAMLNKDSRGSAYMATKEEGPQQTPWPSTQPLIKPFDPSTQLSSRVPNPTLQEPAQKDECRACRGGSAAEVEHSILEIVKPSDLSNQVLVRVPDVTLHRLTDKVCWVMKVEDTPAFQHSLVRAPRMKRRKRRQGEILCNRFSQRRHRK
eukprot:gnl/MRDRNA2_/MRDRNA2_29729_c0_seq1.p1 gnl/MRDRNA2_/MRDRNA2_29729_c0~~gnl/MRDRNA2_/MRDRNA2_29729_c0_seq1.p1  ORF type:complete len:326 (+),score=44.30 gnl/MRDRNA2_/MRDRNA2_29729_c0_seq1:108-1085(+)